jgi:putative transposase
MGGMWTKEHRARRARQAAFERGRRHPTDLSDDEWERIRPLPPEPAPRGRKPGVDRKRPVGTRGQAA